MGEAAACAKALRERLGPPDLGIVLGSGFGRLARSLGAVPAVPPGELPGWPDQPNGGVAAAALSGRTLWIVMRRVHLYEGHSVDRVAYPVEVLAAAGAKGILLTTAAGGLLEQDEPGDFAVITDHVNLTGEDPLRQIPCERREPAFLDLQGAYDQEWADLLRRSALDCGRPVRDGVLASLRGPSYETPAEVGMLRSLGADLASMSVVPETIAARYRKLKVAAVACIANRGAGLGEGSISHGEVLDTVERAVGADPSWLVRSMAEWIRS
jgi:purine-nucleoside phosphorylase